ncbi:tyrosine-type recombinase/integrase [Paraburkholderia youngii]|uniref:tyrosine-type recombinase/integrase n=1 Tax=Paraburkholderia youngii TaxID=2782701 RepID=UPI003D1C0EF8
MRLLFHSDGVAGYVPPGFQFPTLIDSRGFTVVAAYLYMLYQVATNAWSSEATARTCARRLLDIFAYFEDNEIPFEKATVSNLTEYREYKLKFGIEGKPCSQSTVNTAVSLFKKFWAWALKEGLIVESAAVSIAEYSTRTRGLPAFTDLWLPTAEEIKQFLSQMRGPEERIATGLTFCAGLRRAEVTSLPADILLSVDQMNRRGGAVRLELDGYHAPTKGKRRRTVEIPLRLYGEMINYKMSDRRANRIERSSPACNTLLITKYGHPCKPDWLNDVFARASVLCGLAIHPHLLRHWYATRFLEYETPERFKGNMVAAVEALQRLLGHADIKTTFGYVHLAILEGSEKVRALMQYQRALNDMLKE